LDDPRHDERRLGLPMAVEYMSQVEEWGPTRIAGIEDFKQGVKEPIQIDRWRRNPSKH
jgi:hypothetical protein